MAKKKKGKKGGKSGKKKKGGLTNLEREKFRLSIGTLENKIEWRQQLCEAIEEDIGKYKQAYESEEQDKQESVGLLEDAIQETTKTSEKLQRTIPDAESFKLQTEERQTRELAARLIQLNEEKSSYNAQLEVYRQKLRGLENYNARKVEEKIEEIERQLASEDAEDTFLKGIEQDRRREDTFKRELQEILKDQANMFQNELRGRLDENFERLAEETRWWTDNVNGLRIMSERLQENNEAKAATLRNARRDLAKRRKAALQASMELQEQERTTSVLLKQTQELYREKKIEDQLLQEANHLEDIQRNLDRSFESLQQKLKRSDNNLVVNENEIKELEDQLSNEIQFGLYMEDFVQKAQYLVAEEAKHSLIITHDGLPQKKLVLKELEFLFDDATEFIYSLRNEKIME